MDYTLPRDIDGYVKSFSITQTTDINLFLKKYGVVIISNVIDSSEINNSIDAIWNNPELESRGVKRYDKGSWERCWPRNGHIERKGWIESGDTMLCPIAWKNRLHPNIQHIFQGIWDLPISDLRVKPDRYGVMRPLINSKWRTDEGWLHHDQNPKLETDFIRYQGILTFTDSSKIKQNGGFICVPGFHHQYKAYCERNIIDEDVCMLSNLECEKLITEKIYARAGSFIIWDSRLPHANFPNDSTSDWRMIQYITYYPSSYDIGKRLRIVKENAHAVRSILGSHNFNDDQFTLMGGN